MTDTVKGLSSEGVIRSKELHGDNALTKEKTKGFVRKFFENLGDPIIKVLLIATALDVIFTWGHCNWFETGGILLAVLIATTVSTASEYGSERAFARMHADAENTMVRVFRDGYLTEIRCADIVVGDAVFLSAGERVPADGTMLQGKITVDQSALNGESRDITKVPGRRTESWALTEPTRVFRGSVVTGGEGVMLVGRVGHMTYYGMVAKDVQTETRESPLKLRLSKLASQISKIGYVMAAVVAVTYLFNFIVADNGFRGEDILLTLRDFPTLFSALTHALTLMITVVVVAVPEGLPMMITVVLSANMKKMMRDGVLVKKPVGIETAGSMNILFTDKTGTLTTGKLSCLGILTAEGNFRTAAALRGAGRIGEYLLMSAKYNTDCVFDGSRYIGGNGTDRAIAAFFAAEEAPHADVIRKIPFSSERKFSAVTVGKTASLYYIKGAPERILDRATGAVRADGSTTTELSAFRKAYREAAERGERVIAVAVGHGDAGGELLLVGLIFLRDKIRRGVQETVRTLCRAGIQTVMITGDSLETAMAIAAECGIYRPSAGHMALSCDDLSHMSDEEVKKILPNLRVVARALPQDKTRLVRLSQEVDMVVGMTGDGINDAPSLKLADVGFAMGSGTDIAKDAGDVVLLDDSLDDIAHTVLYGRTIFGSIRKFITFQLMMNLAACGVSLVGQFLGIDNPITIVQMLWVNIIMDTLGGLAFAGEAALPDTMREKPKRRDEPILTGHMLRRIVLTGGYTLALCVAFLKHPLFYSLFRPAAGEGYFLTGFYALFIFAGIFNCFNARSDRLRMFAHLGKNKPFIFIMLLIACIQVWMIYFGGALFRAMPLTFGELFRTILLAFSVIPFDFVCRLFGKLHK